MTCARCRSPIPEGNPFCGQCGARAAPGARKTTLIVGAVLLLGFLMIGGAVGGYFMLRKKEPRPSPVSAAERPAESLPISPRLVRINDAVAAGDVGKARQELATLRSDASMADDLARPDVEDILMELELRIQTKDPDSYRHGVLPK